MYLPKSNLHLHTHNHVKLYIERQTDTRTDSSEELISFYSVEGIFSLVYLLCISSVQYICYESKSHKVLSFYLMQLQLCKSRQNAIKVSLRSFNFFNPLLCGWVCVHISMSKCDYTRYL